MNYGNKGFGVVEILVAATIVTLVLVGLHSAAVQSMHLIRQSTERTQATFLLEETIEALRSLRDDSWSAHIDTLSTGTDYFLDWSGGTWTVTTTNTFIDDIFERKFVLEGVNRDGNDDIAASGTLDPGTKFITATVAWRDNSATTTQTINTYITDMFNN